jgi:hypothetical protein
MPPEQGSALAVVEWAITHGVPGVLAVVAVVLALTLRKMYQDNAALHAQRVADLKDFLEKSRISQDKIHKTADDLARFVEFSNQRRPR